MDGVRTDLGRGGIELWRHSYWSTGPPRPRTLLAGRPSLPQPMRSSAGFGGTGRTLATVSRGLSSKYPPRKQLTWSQCQAYIKAPVMLLVQLDNLDTPTRLALKAKLSPLGLSLKTPKAHILKKAIRQSDIRELEPSIVGFMGVATSRREPSDLLEALRMLNSHTKITLIGGKVGTHAFTLEGISSIVAEVPPMQQLRGQLVGLLQSPAQIMSSMLQRAPQALASALNQHLEALTGTNGEGKE